MRVTYRERAVVFPCAGESLVGVIALPERPSQRGVLIVVGGPQYRVGSHRQFVLLARQLAQNGIAAMRFDYRGMGDGGGDLRGFEQVDGDLRVATDCFIEAVPEVTEVVLWGLCDGASAALLRAARDDRITGLVLLNPWVRTDAGEAKTYLKHYYLRRILATDFWRKAVAGRLDWKTSTAGLASFAKLATRRANRSGSASSPCSQADETNLPLPVRMAYCLERFRGRVLLVLSGNDMTAKEFVDCFGASPRWQALLANERVTRMDVAEANHTFSSRAWRNMVATATIEWMQRWPEARSRLPFSFRRLRAAAQ